MPLMEAEILFLDPADVSHACEALTKRGFEVKVLDGRVDPCGPTVWINAKIAVDTKYGEDDFFDEMLEVVKLLRSDLVEAGRAD